MGDNNNYLINILQIDSKILHNRSLKYFGAFFSTFFINSKLIKRSINERKINRKFRAFLIEHAFTNYLHNVR